MKDSIYRVTFFIYVTIYVSLFFSGCANSLPKREGFKPSESLETLTKLKEKKTLSAYEKLDLACAYFWLGHHQNTIAILDPENRYKFIDDIDNLRDPLGKKHFLTEKELEDWEKNSPKERAQLRRLTLVPVRLLEKNSPKERAEAFLYLGYSYLSLGYESEAYKNFINAFGFYPDLEFDNNALRYDYLEGMITDAKIAAQMVELNLFVAVDISKSVSQSQIKNIKELQLDVCNKLKSADHVLFFRFADMSSHLPFPDSEPSPNSIVKDLRTAESTDFVKLFEKLRESMQNHEGTVTDPERQTAILIISDGEHSVLGNEGGSEARIPTEVSRELAELLDTYGDIPIVIITVDRTRKEGSDYAAKWTEEFDTYPVKNKKSFYYDSESKERNLGKIFDTIAPHRSETFIIRDPKAENQSSVFNKRNHILKLLIQNPLQRARIEVTGKPNWQIEFPLFSSNWVEDPAESITTIGPGEHPKSVNITCLNMNEVIPPFQRPKPLIFTLTFHLHPEQGMGEKKSDIGKVNLLFQKGKPTLEITKQFGHKVILPSKAKRHLKFQADIESSHHFHRQLIPLKVKISENHCLTMNGGTINPSTAIISLETGGQTGRHEFNLPIVAETVDGFFGKQFNNDVTINFPTKDNITEYNIDNQVNKTDFRVVPRWLYVLYHTNRYVWIPFVAILICVALYPFFDDKIRTITRISGEEFTVSGNTIYDSKGRQILLLRQKWWFVKFELAKDSLKSGIETTTLFWQRSGKEKVDHEKIDLLSYKGRMKLRGTYRITLSENTKTESKFNVDWNYRLQTWHKKVKWVWIPLGICATALGFAGFYVPWPVPLLHIIIFAFLLISFVIVFGWKRWYSYRTNNSMDNLVFIGRGISFLDAVLSILEKVF